MKRTLYLAVMAIAFAACKKDRSEILAPEDLVGTWKMTASAAIYSGDPSWKPYSKNYDLFFHITNDSTFYYSCSDGLCNTISGRYKIIPSGVSQAVLMVRTINTNVPATIIDTLFIEKLSATAIEENRALRGDKNLHESYRYVKQ